METKNKIKQVITELLENWEYLGFKTINGYCVISGITSTAEKVVVYEAVKHKIKY